MKNLINSLVSWSAVLLSSSVFANGYYAPSYGYDNYQAYSNQYSYPSYSQPNYSNNYYSDYSNSYPSSYQRNSNYNSSYQNYNPYYAQPIVKESVEPAKHAIIKKIVVSKKSNQNAEKVQAVNSQPVMVKQVKSKAIESKPTKIKKSLTKTNFINKVLPLVIRENIKIKQDRKQLFLISETSSEYNSLSAVDKQWLKQLAKKYKLYINNKNYSSIIAKLHRRVNTINPAMAMAQAAIESGWGKSRFTHEANNIFGIWTYNEAIGLIPKKREPNKKHFIRVFKSFDESIAIYMNTLNTHKAYTKLRDIRALREELKDNEFVCDVSTTDQVNGLELYSARGKEYISLVKNVIRQNNLKQLSQQAIIKLDAENLVALLN